MGKSLSGRSSGLVLRIVGSEPCPERRRTRCNSAGQIIFVLTGALSEGFDTRDLKQAKALLEELAA
jgi:hypothetical protein